MLKAVLVFKTHVWVLWKPDTSCFNAEVLRNAAGASMCSLFSKSLTSVMCVETVSRFVTCLESKAVFVFQWFSIVTHACTHAFSVIYLEFTQLLVLNIHLDETQRFQIVPLGCWCNSLFILWFFVFPVFSLLSFMWTELISIKRLVLRLVQISSVP